MATKFLCDVEGCEKTEPRMGGMRGGAAPTGWRIIHWIEGATDVERARASRKMEGMPEGPIARRVRDRVAMGAMMKHRSALICPEHELPKFKEPDPADEEDIDESLGLDYLAAGPGDELV